jgi:hypothetical protein
LRHKQFLKRLELYNVVGLDQRIPAPPLSDQYIVAGYPEDPTPSLQALSKSLKLWQHELDKLADLHVAIGLNFYDIVEVPAILDAWLLDSEIQALAETLGVRVERIGSTVGRGKRAIFHLKGSADSIRWESDLEF